MPRLRCSSTRASVICASAADAVRPARWTNPAVISPYSALPISNSPSPESSITWFTSRDPSSSGDALLNVGQLGLADGQSVLVDDEDQIEPGDLLLDQAPLVHAARALEQQRLGGDRHQKVLALGAHIGLEVERPLCPGEQVVDRLLDLHPHVALEIRLGDHTHADQNLAELLAGLPGLAVDGGVELPLGDLGVLDEDVAQPI